MEIDEMIKVLEHFKAGGEVEFRPFSFIEWRYAQEPSWDFRECEYRVKQFEQPTPKFEAHFTNPLYEKLTAEVMRLADAVEKVVDIFNPMSINANPEIGGNHIFCGKCHTRHTAESPCHPQSAAVVSTARNQVP